MAARRARRRRQHAAFVEAARRHRVRVEPRVLEQHGLLRADHLHAVASSPMRGRSLPNAGMALGFFDLSRTRRRVVEHGFQNYANEISYAR